MKNMTNNPLSIKFIKDYNFKVDWHYLEVDPYHCEIQSYESNHYLIIGYNTSLRVNANYLNMDYGELIERFKSFSGKMTISSITQISRMYFENKDDVERAKEWVDTLLVMKKLTAV